MTTWAKMNICRICSSPAEYGVFAKIPTYLHANANEFLSWQKPINLLLEETTGLKVSLEDGLPHNICALCISYLKHAATFREQAVKNALSLKAVEMMCQPNHHPVTPPSSIIAHQDKQHDKERFLKTPELNFSESRQTDTNLLLNNGLQDQDKVRKQLLNNFQTTPVSTPQSFDQQMHYLHLLFNKNVKTTRNKQQSKELDYAMGGAAGIEVVFDDDDFQTATSSEENEDNATSQKPTSMFTYREKNFEEDDIMDSEGLREAISINIPETFKEHKCRACCRRFMFQESYYEHMETCIEYKFLIFIEDTNRLLDIRRNKGISPHEFIRRMIFALRKTCDWLKINCSDMLLPDLIQTSDDTNKARQESEDKSSATSSGDNVQKETQKLLNKQRNKLTDSILENCNTTKINRELLLTPIKKDNDFDLESNLNNLLLTPKQFKSPPATPLSITNNILYEIERTQSRNSNKQSQITEPNKQNNTLQLSQNSPFMRPIALTASSKNSATKSQIPTTKLNKNEESKNDIDSVEDSTTLSERLSFLQKLQQAAVSQSPTTAVGNEQQQQTQIPISTAPCTPIISVRSDLMPEQQTPFSPYTKTISKNSAVCNACNIVCETLRDLELHNGMYHNYFCTPKQQPALKIIPRQTEAERLKNEDEERKRIIALFDEDENGI